jgi:hypothetical protein
MADSKLTLTAENYYSPAADKAYMSCSQYDAFNQCEAAALAELTGEVIRKKTTNKALIIGNYFHTAMESPEAHAEFIEEHWNDIYVTKKGDKEADFVLADEMIRTARQEPKIARIIKMPGENEVIMTGTMFGSVPWKVRFDKYIRSKDPLLPRLIIDWKTVKSINEKMFDEARHEYVRFTRYWGYDRRAAVYCDIEKQNAGSESDALFLLVCISKQYPPNKEMFVMNSEKEYAECLRQMERKALHFQAVKDGLEEAKRCDECAYCRETKKITRPKLFTVLDPGNEEV